MAVFYVDYENGNDGNAGTSFVTRKQTVNSAVSVASSNDEIRVMASPEPTLVGDGYVTSRPGYDYPQNMSSVTYSTTTGESIFTLNDHGFSTGDTVHVFKSGTQPSGVFYFPGTWEITVVDSNRFKLDGYTSTSSSTATNPGQVLNITQRRILLDTAVTQNIACTGYRTASWTASSNVTATLVTQTSPTSSTALYTEHIFSDQFVISSSFTTGKAAYYTLPSTLNLSGYQQISFKVHHTISPNVTSGNLNYSLRLCSDTLGNTTVNTINIPAPMFSGTTQPFVPITVDLGTSLSSSINSIALYVDSDIGAQTIQLSNIIACKASSSNDSLTLNSLIGRNTTNNDSKKEWYAIESINGRRVLLENMGGDYNPNTYYNGGNASWFGDTAGTYSFYKIEPIRTASTASNDYTILANNSFKFNITISGGWNRTDMSTQTTTAMTFLDGVVRYGYGAYLSLQGVRLSNMGFIRYFTTVYNARSYAQLENIMMITTRSYALYSTITSTFDKFKNVQVHGCSSNYAFYFVTTSTIGYADIIPDTAETDIVCTGCSRTAIYVLPSGGSTVQNRKHYLGNVRIYYNGTYGSYSNGLIYCGQASSLTFNNINLSPGCPLYSNAVGLKVGSKKDPVIVSSFTGGQYWTTIQMEGASTLICDTVSITNNSGYYYGIGNNGRSAITFFGPAKAYFLGGSMSSRAYLQNEGEIYLDGVTWNPNITNLNMLTNAGAIYSKNHNGVSGDYYNLVNLLEIVNSTAQTHTASGYSWRINPVFNTSSNEPYPYEFQIARVSAKAGTSITLKIWAYRESTVSVLGLKVKGLGISGVNDTTSVMSGSQQTWEELSVTVTPTENCILDAYIVLTAGTSTTPTGYMYIDDFTVE